MNIRHDDVILCHLTSYDVLRKFTQINADVSKNERKLEKSIGSYLSNEGLTNSNGLAVKKLFRLENSSLIMYFLPISHDNDVITRQWSDEI